MTREEMIAEALNALRGKSQLWEKYRKDINKLIREIQRRTRLALGSSGEWAALAACQKREGLAARACARAAGYYIYLMDKPE